MLLRALPLDVVRVIHADICERAALAPKVKPRSYRLSCARLEVPACAMSVPDGNLVYL